MPEEIIWAILLINYLPEINPDVPSDSIEPDWHRSSEFKADYKYALARAEELWSWLHKRVPDSEMDWNRLTQQIENEAWEAIEYYQDPDATPKVPKKLQVTFMCIGQDHQHD